MTTMTIIDNENGNTNLEDIFAYIGKGRATHWFLTENNFDNATLEKLKLEPTKYLVFQTEKVSQNHYHACLSYRNARSFNSIKKKFPRAKIQRVRNLQRAREYCMKDESWTGTRFERIGKRIIQNLVNVKPEDQIKKSAPPPVGSQQWMEDNVNLTLEEFKKLGIKGEPTHWDEIMDAGYPITESRKKWRCYRNL